MNSVLISTRNRNILIKVAGLLLLLTLGLPGYGQFITTWQTDNLGTSNDNQITIPIFNAETYVYDVIWGDGNSDFGVAGNITHTYAVAGTYTVSISGTFPRIFFNGGGDRRKILTIEQWGGQSWTSMAGAFRGCMNLTIPASDIPNLAGVTDMSSMFRSAASLNADISSWDVSNVTDMSRLFMGASVFNQSLNAWDVGAVTDMSSMFQNASDFNGNISAWNVSNVTSTRLMFRVARVFNQDISGWNVGNVTDMQQMFDFDQDFNQPIGSWDVSSVTTMQRMFGATTDFNQNINTWDVSSVTNMIDMFNGAPVFNQPIDGWNVGNVTNMQAMFRNTDDFNQNLDTWNVSSVITMINMFNSANAFNSSIGSWNVGNVTNMNSMFRNANLFDQPIGAWDVSSVTNMNALFAFTPFNQDISTWDMTSVTTIERMFNWSPFNQNINTWNVSNITTMRSTFSGGAFNMPLESWDVSNVTDMTDMFSLTPFNQDIGSWEVSNVGFMGSMFNNASAFNQDLGLWDVTSVINMSSIFRGTAFDHSLASWDISNALAMSFMFDDSGISVDNYDQTIIAWAALPGPLLTGVTFGGTSVFYCTSGPARATLFATYGWVFSDGGLQCPAGEIAIFEGPNNTGTELADGQVNALDYGIGILPTDIVKQFTIENQGAANIVVANITLSGTAFTILSPTTYTIPPGNSETIDVQLSGATVGVFTETLTVLSDDADEASFDFPITGDIRLTAESEIVVYEGSDVSGLQITDGQITVYNLGSGVTGLGLTNQITIENIGTATLNLSNITVTGTSFSILSATTANINTGSTLTIDIMLSGATINTFTETLTINSDDVDEPNFSFPITGDITAAPQPEIGVFQSSTEIFDGQLTPIDFGSGNLGTDITLQFSISNSGSADLNISNISISGTAFNITSAIPTISEFDEISPTFDISLSGAVAGTFNETITIESDDADENPFTFDLIGTITALPAPEINLFEGVDNTGTVITNAQASAIDFGSALLGSPITQSFAIENTGTSILNILSVSAGGTDYSVTSTISTVAVGATENFTVILFGTTSGTFNSVITIANDDANENPFTFNITGQINMPVIDIFDSDGTGGNIIVNSQATPIEMGQTPQLLDLDKIFTIQNMESVALNIASITTDNAVFEVINPPTSVQPATSEIFIIRLIATDIGRFTTQVTITLDFGDFVFPVSGEVVPINQELVVFNAISPNGDGKHDFLEMQNIGLFPNNEVKIMNRWGEIIYETSGYDNVNNKFEGIIGGGGELPAGTYYYIISLGDGSQDLRGFFNLRR